MKNFYTLSSIITFLFTMTVSSSFAQNLITNGDAELPPETNGWTVVTKGTDCWTGSQWHITGNQNGFPASQSGTYIFYSGCNEVNGELYQDVDVSAYSATIDGGTETFTFTGYTQSYNERNGDVTKNDRAQIIVEYRASDGTVLATFDTGETNDHNGWTQRTDIRVAPATTRTVRITLKSFRTIGTSVDGYFDNLSLLPSTVLPVELANFEGYVLNESVMLNWRTLSEENNEKFEVEVSVEGGEFEKIGEVAGHGTTVETQDYTFTVENPSEGVNYYRLKQMDFDGQFEYSDVISVYVEGSNRTIGEIYPNPSSSGLINLNYTVEESEELPIILIHKYFLYY